MNFFEKLFAPINQDLGNVKTWMILMLALVAGIFLTLLTRR